MFYDHHILQLYVWEMTLYSIIHWVSPTIQCIMLYLHIYWWILFVGWVRIQPQWLYDCVIPAKSTGQVRFGSMAHLYICAYQWLMMCRGYCMVDLRLCHGCMHHNNFNVHRSVWSLWKSFAEIQSLHYITHNIVSDSHAEHLQ